MRRRLAALATAAITAATAADASAHVTGLSRGDYTPSGATVHAEIAMRADEASLAGTTPAALVRAIAMTADGAACSPHLDSADPEAPDGVRVRATFTCPHAPSQLHVHFGLLDLLPSGHRHLATVHLPRGDVDTLAVLANPDFDVTVAPAPAPASAPGLAARARLPIAAGAVLLLLAGLGVVVSRQRAAQAASDARRASRAGP